jgi:hypothetical protein
MAKKILTVLTMSLAFSSMASAKLVFHPISSYQEIGGTLPPKLQVTFELSCFEKLVSVIRHDIRDSATNEVTIAVGGLVDIASPRPCPNQKVLVDADAGNTFSGVQYHIEAIQK